jgi:hypothetical protein
MENIKKHETYDNKLIKKYGLVDTGTSFADLQVLKKGDIRYLVQRINENETRIVDIYQE